MSATTLRRAAPAKINLGLHVLARRDDGYHDVETVLIPIGWADEVRADPAPALTLACDDPTLPIDSGNLVLRAARALAELAGVSRGAELELAKRVPYGAGLGGGSSDAAATLRLLADLWNLDLEPAELHALAAGLGADVPFFLESRPALARGRGEVLEPLGAGEESPYRLPYSLVVAVPPVRVSTADAYRIVTPDNRGRPDLSDLVRSNDLERWRSDLVNDFRGPISEAYPEVAVALAALTSLGAGYVSLSGSGSAVFGVFDVPDTADTAAVAMREAGCEVWVERPG